MKRQTNAIVVPAEFGYDGLWVISYPWRKLQIKYGLKGPWRTANWAVAFDAYAETRGPENGLPDLRDLAITSLMNSGVNKTLLLSASKWLAAPGTNTRLRNLRAHLEPYGSLTEMPEQSVRAIGKLLESIVCSPNRPSGFARARFFKWFCAWAPSHLPMLDKWVLKAVEGNRTNGVSREIPSILLRYQALLRNHSDILGTLGHRLSRQLRGKLNRPVPSVRVLENLIWCDWCGIYDYPEAFASDFQPAPNKSKWTEHKRI